MILLKKLTAESAEIYGCDFTGSGKSDTNFPNYHEKLMKIRENSCNSWQKFSQPHEFPKSQFPPCVVLTQQLLDKQRRFD